MPADKDEMSGWAEDIRVWQAEEFEQELPGDQMPDPLLDFNVQNDWDGYPLIERVRLKQLACTYAFFVGAYGSAGPT